MAHSKEKKDILVYGLDKLGYQSFYPVIENAEYRLHFFGFSSDKKFQDYDGVVLFQSIFEKFVQHTSGWGQPNGEGVRYDEQELLKREKQLQLLLDKKGFVCFLLYKPFVSYTKYGNANLSDLTKRVLKSSEIHEKNLSQEVNSLHIVRDEFRKFLKHYGCARTKFDYVRNTNIKPICRDGFSILGFVLENNIFFLPTLTPDDSKSEFSGYFVLLVDSLITSFKRLSGEIPEWVDEYRFLEEADYLKEKDEHIKQINILEEKIEGFRMYKGCLCFSGDLLTDSILAVLEEGFGLKIDPEDEGKQDLKILDNDGNPIVLVENKGISQGLQNTHIYQADSHRGRSKLHEDFPSILIVNQNISTSSSIEDKNKDLNDEQIRFAVSKKILVLMTIDLLNLLYLFKTGKISSEKLIELFTKELGWLKATTDGFSIENGIKNETV